MNGTLDRDQVDQLLAGINPGRVLRDAKGHSHVAQQDIRAHLSRIFGFGGWDQELLELTVVDQTQRVDDKGNRGGWDVTYRCQLRLTVRNRAGQLVASWDDAATATGSNQRTLGDAHDLACKSAVSYALKRCATSLGDQFGLSLYNKGQTSALVRGTLVLPAATDDAAAQDIQAGVPAQVSLGNVEGGADPDDAPQPMSATDDLVVLRAQLIAEGRRVGLTSGSQLQRLEDAFAEFAGGTTVRSASAAQLRGFLHELTAVPDAAYAEVPA